MGGSTLRPVSQGPSHVIEMLRLDGPTLSPMLKRLEAAGLVTRTRDPTMSGSCAST